METPAAPLAVRPPTRTRGGGPLAWGVGALIVFPALSWPLQGIASWLGAPGFVCRWAIGAVPDAIAGTLVVVGVVHAARGRQRPDRIDWAVAAFVGLATGYLLADRLALAADHDLFPDGPDGFYVQLVALRAAVVAPLLFVAVRSFRWRRTTIHRLLDLLQVTAVVLAAGAVVQALFPKTWEHVGIDVLGLLELRRDVYGVIAPPLVEYTTVGDRTVVRAGSFLLEHLQLGFILIPGLTLCLVRAARLLRWTDLASLVVVTAGIVASQGRAAVACTAVAGLVVLATRPPGAERRRLQRLGAATIAAFAVLAVATGLVDRFVATAEQGDESTSVHVNSTREALDIVGDHPLGTGLGTGIAGSSRPHEGGSLVSENAYLDVGIQVGVAAMALQVMAVTAVGATLCRRVRAEGDEVVVALTSFVALTLGGLVLHTWQMLETTWIVFALAAIALPRVAGPD